MRASIIALGFAATLAPAMALAQTAPPADPTAPPPTYAPPPGQPVYAPPPPQPGYAPAPPMAVASLGAAPSLKGFSAWGILPWSGIGVGARFMLPMPISPLLTNSGIRDSWALEFGADFMHWSYGYLNYDWSYNQVVPVVGLMWNIWLTQQFALYPKLEAGYAFGWWSGFDTANGQTQADHPWLFWDVTAGLMYKLNSGLTLRAEAGYAGLKLGVGWLF